MTSGINGFHTLVHGHVCTVLPLQHEIRVLQAMTECCVNLAMRLRVGPLCSTIQLSPVGLPSTKHRRSNKLIQYSLAANFASWVGLGAGIVEPFKHLLHATTHSQFWCLSCERPWALVLGNMVIFHACNKSYITFKTTKGSSPHASCDEEGPDPDWDSYVYSFCTTCNTAAGLGLG